MNKLIYVLGILLLFNSCTEENELEGITLENENDVAVVDYLSMTNIREDGCNVIVFDLIVKENNIPENLNYTHYVISDDFNRARKTNQIRNIYMSVSCLPSMRFKLSLLNEESNELSAPSYHDFIR